MFKILFIEIIFLMFLGIFIGIFTGLLPGIHVNLVATTLFAISPVLLRYLEPLSLGVFIISLAITHSFLDTIPSIYLGAPENENSLSVLPGQKMLLQGQGYQAVKITILGTYFGLILAVFLIPLFYFIAKKIYPFFKPYLLFFLILIILFMIFKEKNFLLALLIFFLSGILGLLVFDISKNPFSGIKEPLFSLLSGLFGISGLIISFFENTKIPNQVFDDSIDITLIEAFKSIFASSIGVFFIQFFPGLGPAQGAIISSQFIKNIKDKLYLALVGAQGTMSVVFSLVTFYILGKAKDGSLVVLSKLIKIDFQIFLILIFVMLFSGSISIFLVFYFSKIFTKIILKINYQILVLVIIFFIFLMSFILNGLLGILILISSTSIGLLAPLKGVARNHAMGCLLLPVIFYFLGI
ncbi:MAG: tripartite tricarboxylate transporter permease [Candidatus Woesearchaeota archaeon]